VACMLRDGSVSARHFTEAAIADPELVALAHRVHVAPDTGIDALGNDKRYTVDVEIETTDGLVLHGHGDDRPGGPSQPLSRDQVIAKYNELAGPVVGDDRAKSIRALVEVIDELDDVGELATLLAYDATT
jgi:2-methylcitrate dehydratase PrpD